MAGIPQSFVARKSGFEPSLTDGSGNSRIEPAASLTAALVSTIPDAADVLALKVAIDNLARQVAALEQRFAAGQQASRPRLCRKTGASTKAL